MSAFVSFFGVLRTDTGAPLFSGIAVVKALIPEIRTVIFCPESEDFAQHLLREDGIADYARLITGKSFSEALAEERAFTSSISMVFTADPEESEEASSQGLTVFRVSAQNFVRPDWKMVRRNWEAIENENRIPGR